jgi:polysaccharide export outer membrane protein
MRKYLLLLLLTATTSLAWAQMPTDFSKVKVSELSDDQIRDILKQGEAKGLSITDGESLALSMGLPATEAAAFKARVAGLGNMPIKEALLTPVATPEASKNILKPTSVVPRNEKPAEVAEQDASKPTLFGRSIYQSGGLELMGQATDTKAPDSYVLGPGDELVVSVFGSSYANEVIKIDSRGAARVKGMGTLYLTGLTFEAARKLLRTKFGQYYDLNNNQFEITLLFSRVIRVHVVGEVSSPGTYEFSALNSVFNALIAASGPSPAGSVRQIEVQRGGKVVYQFDTYHFLAGSASAKPFSLEDQDYIVVKALGSVVELEGAVRRPATYELLPGEGIEALIKWAGGLSSNAYQGSIQRITFANGAREVKEFQMTAGKMPLDSLRDGDQILVRGLPDDVRNALEIDGDVNQPGSYTFAPNITVYELIRRAGGLKPTAYMQKAFLSRRKTDASREMIALDLNGLMTDSLSSANVKLQPYDKVLVASKSDLIDTYDIQVIGAVRKPGAIEYASGLTIGDLLLQVGGLKPEADVKRIEIMRISLFDEQKKAGTRLFTVSVEVENGELKGADLSKMLMPYDRVYVRTLADFMSPASVTLTGEFNFPGTYALLSRDERLSDLIQRAGGLKPYAFVAASRFYRQTAPGSQVLLDLEKVLRSSNSRYNYRLQDGDSISVPEFVPYVSIQGLGVQYLNTTGLEAVNAPFKTGLRADGFVKRYGDGFSDRANKKRLFVVAADDRVSRTKSFLGIKFYPKVEPGATVYVMEKEITKKEREKGEPLNWNKVIENTTVKLTGLATLYLIFSQVAAR